MTQVWRNPEARLLFEPTCMTQNILFLKSVLKTYFIDKCFLYFHHFWLYSANRNVMAIRSKLGFNKNRKWVDKNLVFMHLPDRISASPRCRVVEIGRWGKENPEKLAGGKRSRVQEILPKGMSHIDFDGEFIASCWTHPWYWLTKSFGLVHSD